MHTPLAPLAAQPLNLPTVTFEAAEKGPDLLANNLNLYMAFAYGAYKARPKSNPIEAAISATFVGRIATAKASVDAFTIAESQEAILAFRGSSRLTHWHSNLMADWVEQRISDQPAGRVHRGFHEAATAIEPHCMELLAECAKLAGGVLRRITYVGHSRGGPIATLTAASLNVEDTEIQIYTFGAPRVGCWKFAKAFETLGLLHWRCEMLGDPIPVVGFIGMHTGHLARIEDQKLVLVRKEEAPLRRLITTKFTPADIMDKHAAKNYLSVIHNLTYGTV